MSRETYGRMLGIFMMLSLALAGLMVVPQGASAEGMANLKVLVKNQKEENLDSADVKAVNVHTGEDYILSWSDSEGWFEANVQPGTYQVFASSDGYVSPGEPQMVYGLSEDNEDVPQVIISLRKIDNQADFNIQVADGPMMEEDAITGAMVHLFPEDGGHLQMSTDEGGWANFSVPNGEIHVLIYAPGMLVASYVAEVNNTLSMNFVMEDEPSGDEGSYRIMGLVKSGMTFVPGLSIHIWDGVNDHMVPVREAEDGAISVPLYPSTFHMLVEAEGYEPYWLEGIDLTAGDNYYRPVNNTFEMIPVETEESKMTVIDMSGEEGIVNPDITTEWTMDANSMLYGTPTSFGNPRMQASGVFPTADWMDLTAQEVEDVEETLSMFGPAWADTEYFFKVNNEAYTADVDAYDVDLQGLEGDITEKGVNPVATMGTDYSTELAFEEGDDLRIEVTALLEGETIEIMLPDDYEILGDFDEEEAEYPDGNTSRLMIHRNMEFNAKQEVRPVADLDFVSSMDSYRVDDKSYIVKVDENVTLTAQGSYDEVGEIVEYHWNSIPSSARIWIDDEMVDYDSDLTTELDELVIQFTENSGDFINITLQVLDSAGHMAGKVDYINILPDSSNPTISNFTISRQMDGKEDEWELLAAPFTSEEDVSLQFNASASDNGEIVDYVWTFSDDSGSINGKVVTHSFADPGEFEISLTVIDAVGNEMEAQNKTITISDETEPMSVIKPFEDGLKIGDDVEFNATQSYDPRTTEDVTENLSFEWAWYAEEDDWEDQTTFGTDEVFDYSFDEPGVYMINLTVTDAAGNKGWSQKVLTIYGVDLVVTNFEFVDPAESDLKEDEDSEVSVLVENVGQVDAESEFQITLYRNEDDIKSKSVDGLEAGKRFYWNFTFTQGKAGEFEFKVIVDSGETIEEDTEDNNELMVPATVAETKSSIWDYWYVIPIVLVILVIVYVVYMKYTRGLWGYEPIMDWWNKRNA